MTRGNLRKHLEEFYGSESPAAETVDRLRLLASVDASGAHPGSHHTNVGWWSPRITGIAASLALLLSAASFYVVITRTSPTSQPVLVANYDANPVPVRNTNVSLAKGVPNLVAVKFQIDGCPAAAAVEPMFCELIKKFADKSVFFTRYDMSNSVEQRLSANWATGLGVEWACQGASQSGTILLIDRTSCEVVAKLTDRQGLSHMVRTLDRLVH